MTDFRLLAGTKFIISNKSEEGKVWLIFVYLHHICCQLKMAKETCTYRIILIVTTFIVRSPYNKQHCFTYQDFCTVFVHWGSRCCMSPLNPKAVERRLQNSLNDLNCSPFVLRNLNSSFYERSFLCIGNFWFYFEAL